MALRRAASRRVALCCNVLSSGIAFIGLTSRVCAAVERCGARAQDKCHPQTLAVTASRADGLGLKVKVGNEADFEFGSDVCGVLLQYPATDGSLHDYKVDLCPVGLRVIVEG